MARLALLAALWLATGAACSAVEWLRPGVLDGHPNHPPATSYRPLVIQPPLGPGTPVAPTYNWGYFGAYSRSQYGSRTGYYGDRSWVFRHGQ